MLYGLDRFSKDLDFSRLTPDPAFSLGPCCGAIRRELESFGFEVTVESKPRYGVSAIDAARDEVSRFVRDPSGLSIWSREFFLEIIERIETV